MSYLGYLDPGDEMSDHEPMTLAGSAACSCGWIGDPIPVRGNLDDLEEAGIAFWFAGHAEAILEELEAAAEAEAEEELEAAEIFESTGLHSGAEHGFCRPDGRV